MTTQELRKDSIMGFTILATLDEHGEFISQFTLPFALTEAQQDEVRHGAIDYAGSAETYFVVDDEHDADDEAAVDDACEMIAQLHVVDVKAGLFTS